MFQVARNDRWISPCVKQQGIALLMMLALILVAFTTIAISRLSENSFEQNARARTTQALVQSRDAIMAYTLTPQNPATTAPGILPCPDTDGDGISNPISPSATPCPRIGLVPYVTLRIPKPFDATNSPIWYAVSTRYSVSTPYNSSTQSLLTLNNTQPMAFILLAPNKPLAPQVRTSQMSPRATAVAQFLEGDNADAATPNSYTSIRDDFDYDSNEDTQNDQVLGVSVVDFWTTVEGQVLNIVRGHLIDYYSRCSSRFPSAVPYLNADDNSAPNTVRGRVPLGNWTNECPNANPLPIWLSTHWSRMIYYTRCPTPASCLQLMDIAGNITGSANALIIGPGAPLNGGLPRPIGSPIGSYFEGQNSDDADNIYTRLSPTNFTRAFNDRVMVVR